MDKIISKVFMWLFAGLAVTFGVAYTVSTNDNMVYNLFSDGKYWIVFIVEIFVVIFLSARIRKMSTMTATVLYFLYSILTGLTLSAIFILYDLSSIIWIFAITALLLLVFAFVGYFTKLDLTKLGVFLTMALLAALLVYLVNIFLGSSSLDTVLSVVFIVIFIGYIGYDIQIIKRNMYMIENEDNLAVYGAFQLYLDFINIFLELLRLFGNRRD